ncbi:MAG TPA: hypothetical protein VN602_13810 [Gemmatimonadaceae bacterium]|nr:hypothetical protein [Gemmatimonadaceae bacterium]
MQAAARNALKAFAAYKAARQARSDAWTWVDRHAEYRATGIAERDTFKALVTAMDELKAVAAREGVQAAAEAGSPQARMLEANR